MCQSACFFTASNLTSLPLTDQTDSKNSLRYSSTILSIHDMICLVHSSQSRHVTCQTWNVSWASWIGCYQGHLSPKTLEQDPLCHWPFLPLPPFPPLPLDPYDPFPTSPSFRGRNPLIPSPLLPFPVPKPWHRRLEAFTTDAKIIPLISRRVTIFPAWTPHQIFDGDCNAANRKKISGVIPPNFLTCGFFDKWTQVFSVDKILHRPMPLHWLSLRCFWSNLVTSVDLQLPAFIIFHQECETNLSFPHLQDFLNIL